MKMTFKLAVAIAVLMSTTGVLALKNTTQFMNDTIFSGYIPVDQEDELFYIGWESRSKPASDPLIIWLQGECSGAIGMFTENGPYNFKFNRTQKPGYNITYNPYSWNNNATVIYLDFPLGVGFSRSASMLNLRYSEYQLLVDFYVFLVGFLEVNSEYKGRPIYLMGTGVAGNYIPYFTKNIMKQNNSDINLAGLAIGNGWVDPFYQYPAHNTYAFENDLISGGSSYVLDISYGLCQFMMLLEVPLLSTILCKLSEFPITGNPLYPKFNTYDIREECHSPFRCYPDNGLELFMTSQKFRPYVNARGPWFQCNGLVAMSLLYADSEYNHGFHLKTLIDNNFPVLIYNGDKDYYYNWKGAEAWTQAIVWKYQDQFNAQPYQEWYQSGTTNTTNTTTNATHDGEFRNYGSFTFFRIFDAGQMVAKDQPKVAVEMINQFIAHGKLLSKKQ